MGAAEDDGRARAALSQLVRHVVDRSDLSYQVKVERLNGLKSVFEQELASAFEPAFNTHLRQAVGDDLESRRAACHAANESLRMLGLAVRSSRTGQPGILLLHVRDADDALGRFCVESRDPAGRLVRSDWGADLPQLTLVENDVRKESFSRAGGPMRGGRSR